MSVLLSEPSSVALFNQTSWAVVDEVQELTEIFRPEINFVGLKRKANSQIAKVVEQINLFNSVLEIIDPHRFDFQSLYDKLDNVIDAQYLVQDIMHLTEIFETITGAEKIGLRLAELTKPMCPGFHFDRVTLRLLCTYTGPATQWVDNSSVTRHQSESKSQKTKTTISVDKNAQIQELDIFDVGFLKGEDWLDENGSNKGKSIVHRSPPIQPGSYRRVILTLDFLE